MMERCPICKREPVITECGPWPKKGYGPPPWYFGCYGHNPYEHYIGGNATTRKEAVANWNELAKAEGAALAAQPTATGGATGKIPQ